MEDGETAADGAEEGFEEAPECDVAEGVACVCEVLEGDEDGMLVKRLVDGVGIGLDWIKMDAIGGGVYRGDKFDDANDGDYADAADGR